MLGIGVFTLAAAGLTAQSNKDRPSLGAIAKAAQEEKAKAEQEKAKTAPTKPESTAPAKVESPAPATTDAKTEKPASRTYTNDDLGRRQPRPLPVYTVDAAAQKPYLTGDRPKDEAYWRSRRPTIARAPPRPGSKRSRATVSTSRRSTASSHPWRPSAGSSRIRWPTSKRS